MTWAWIDHACRACGARIVERREPSVSSTPTYECGSCGAAGKGDHASICGCGILPKPVRAGASAPRFRCTLNPTPGPGNLSVIEIVFDEAPA